MKTRLFTLISHRAVYQQFKFSSTFDSSNKTYSPNTFEDALYNLWEKNGSFQPIGGADKFSMLLPPPNVTGTLHLGHALTVTTQDTWARWRRMCGNNVIWVPGIDHAGIATQTVVEKYLARNGLSRISVGQDKFVEEVWKWKNEKSSIIRNQLKALGSTADWSKEYFTMDSAQSKAVIEALLCLWNKGLIYRDEVLVNWSPHLQSTISDIEVNKIDIDGPTKMNLPGYDYPIEFGNIVDFAYKVVGSNEEIVVSTTRIETMLGDVAVAVNPDDDRFRHLWGSVLLHPFTGSEIPLVLDYNVDPNFGSGALKVTPAHDKTDFLIGKSHNLPVVSVINEDGILVNCGKFSGMKRYDARDAVMNALAEMGLLRSIRPHKMCIPICSRSGDAIELLIKPQWFLKCKNMAEKAILAVKENRLAINPVRYKTNWYNWLENIDDWCISRQLWWGHQVPFYSCEGGGKEVWFPAKNKEEAEEIAKNAFKASTTISRSTDVLDTWFSSALLPFSCFGWPQKTEHFQKFYPLSTLVTGNDILFFWVARMVMLGIELTDQVPFKEILLHGIICDSQGRKMSKSLGNVINPEDVIKGISLEELKQRIENSFLCDEEILRAKNALVKIYPKGISECGVDALRFALLSYNIKNQYINFDVKECEVANRFCNKIWQLFKFFNMWVNKYPTIVPLNESHIPICENKHLMNKWILMKLNLTTNVINDSLPIGDFHVATLALRNFIHHDLCDTYVESIKPFLKRGVKEDVSEILTTLNCVLKTSMKCLFPFMPFISEQLYHSLPGIQAEQLLMNSSYPSADIKEIDDSVLEKVSLALNIVNTIRRLKHNHRIDDHLSKFCVKSEKDLFDIQEIVQTLSRCRVEFGKPSFEKRACKTESVNQDVSVFLYLKVKDINHNTDMLALNKKYEKLKKDLEKMIKMTSNDGYKKVTPQVQKSHQEKIFKLRKEIDEMDTILEKQAHKI